VKLASLSVGKQCPLNAFADRLQQERNSPSGK